MYLAAAALAAAALVLPLWGFSMSAPQYPGRNAASAGAADRHRRRRARGRDAAAVHRRPVPDRLPELKWAPAAMVAVSRRCCCSRPLSGRRTRSDCYRVAVRRAVVVTFSRLGRRRAGPAVPGRARARSDIRRCAACTDFTPPLVGPAKVGNFTVWSFPHAGAVAARWRGGAALGRRKPKGSGVNIRHRARDLPLRSSPSPRPGGRADVDRRRRGRGFSADRAGDRGGRAGDVIRCAAASIARISSSTSRSTIIGEEAADAVRHRPRDRSSRSRRRAAN